MLGLRAFEIVHLRGHAMMCCGFAKNLCTHLFQIAACPASFNPFLSDDFEPVITYVTVITWAASSASSSIPV
jgi:hypothetical protein